MNEVKPPSPKGECLMYTIKLFKEFINSLQGQGHEEPNRKFK
jgi:hypothetical protein